MPDALLTAAQLAARWQVSTRQVERYAAAGMPTVPVGVRARRYDAPACESWLRENHACLSTRPQPAATRSLSASAVAAFTDACRRAQVRVKPSALKPS